MAKIASTDPSEKWLGRLAHQWALRLIVLALSCFVIPSFAPAAETTDGASRTVAVHLFWSEGCPHCANAREFIESWIGRDAQVQFRSHEVTGSAQTETLFGRVLSAFQIEVPAVPLIIVGNRAIIGYRDAQSTGRAIEEAALACRAEGCRDTVALLETQTSPEAEPQATKSSANGAASALPESIRVPLLGEIALGTLPLPALTILLAAIDGFNPCAMWALVFLIGLLLGTGDPVRMWVLGAAFLIASAAVYFALMAAWLNLLLLLGALTWIRIAVGIVDLGGGAFYMAEFFRNPAGVCKVTGGTGRQTLRDRFRRVVGTRSFPLALGGMVAIAVAVNLIELLCSAGIPAIYTQILALNPQPAWQHYLYFLLYILVFLLDDVAIFVTAMATLRASGLTAAYTRYSHLVGGSVLLAIGGLLMLRPQWLTFAP